MKHLIIDNQFILSDEEDSNSIVIDNNNIITGTEENDTIYGSEVNDSINGGNGDNTLYGAMGDDTLVNNFGYVDGDSGYDILIADYSNYETAIQNTDSRNRIERIDHDVDLISFYGIVNYPIVGTALDDSFQASTNDSLDGGEGIDKLSLDFSAETESIFIDLTNADNQATFSNTQVSNFETIGTIYGGSNSDNIILGLSASTSGGYVDGMYGDDTLFLDYSGYETAIQNVDSSRYVERIDNDVDLVIFSDIEQYQITGTDYNDSLQGSSSSDTLIGGDGDDYLLGNNGEDIIIGVNPDLENAGIDEIDTLIGGSGSDSFVLGDSDRVFYNDGEYRTQGIEDYALIKDFDLSEDIIKISGFKSDYRLGFSPITDITGTAIYRVEGNYYNRELIAIVEDVTILNINSNIFRSVINPVDDEISKEEVVEEVELTPEPEEVVEEVEVISQPEEVVEEVELTPQPEEVVEEVELTPQPEEIESENNINQFNSYQEAYQISRLSVGLEINNSDFVGFESDFLADINQDGVVSAFDAYLAYSTFDEI